MQLPPLFKERMAKWLKDEAEPFFNSFSSGRHYGLRINTLKWSVAEALQTLPFHLDPVPWAEEGFYYRQEDRPAKHPYYHAGLYYIQEPSAMAPGGLLPIEPGDKVLDLCAAPGGKSTQVAARLKGKGILVSNDVNPERIKALVKNLELFGVKNVVVTNETPERLARIFPAYFDKILIDAPCSGEGMFRKSPEMMKSWDIYGIKQCAALQESILDEAAKMVKEGGLLLYSTCTFAPEENEGQVARFLKRHPEFEVVNLSSGTGVGRGRAEWVEGVDEPEIVAQVNRTVRIWPHQHGGEGHFVALLVKRKGEVFAPPANHEKRIPESVLTDYRRFEEELLTRPVEEGGEGSLVLFKNHLSLKPRGLPDLTGLKVIRSGWYLGELKKNRFKPSQALAMGLALNQVKKSVSFSVEEEALLRYLKGETLSLKGEKGWKLVCVDRFPLGWAKQVDGLLKNEYPPAWRWMA